MPPKKIRVAREEGFHTDTIGHHRDGQFMGFVVGAARDPLSGAPELSWYAVLHLFTEEGRHIRTQHATGEIPEMERCLREMLGELHSVTYGDVMIERFRLVIDGYTFGLVSRESKLELVPNGLVFGAPWDGFYST
jgi:hypothetical protein